MELKGSKTEANLWIAFAGESQARNKYDYFASKAKKEGYEQIAAIFQETALQTEYAKLQERKEALYADYGKLKKQVKEYDVIKRNVDSILRQPKEPEQEKGKERE